MTDQLDTAAIRDLIADTEDLDTTGLTEERARIVACDRNRLVSSLAHEWRAHTMALRAENERLRSALSPFPEEAAYWFSHNYNSEDRPVEGFQGYTPVMTCGDLFNARAVLRALKGDV